mmetsp:Transcript_7219/g.29989  ORF Transcript_7219/g.29989 Transcript_7219/m.29989 type:complete len:315 (+) Transcript_7219:746-1690(+)
MAADARSMPSRSIASPGSLRSPAVSYRRTARPSNARSTCRTSRVVPGVADTIAAGRCASAFKSEDFPAFGGPASTTRTPSRTVSPAVAPLFFSWRRNSAPSAPTLSRASLSTLRTCGTSPSTSSPKSTHASTAARTEASSSRHRAYRRSSAPDSTESAWRRWRDVVAASRSARPSTWVSPRRPAAKARRENSPLSAGRKPGNAASVSRTPSTTALEPWQWSSTTSSPVNDLGARKYKTRASSRTSRVAGSRSVRTDARRGSGSGFERSPPSAESRRRRPSAARGPESRMTATPETPRPDDRAKIVSAAAAGASS